MALHDMAKMAVSGTPGTGPIILGAAVPGFQTFAAAGAVDAETFSYGVGDTGHVWEVGVATYTADPPSITRAPTASSSGGSAVSLTSAAVVSIVALASDFASQESSTQSLVFSWDDFQVLEGRTIFTATSLFRVTAIVGRVDIANDAAATLAVHKAPSGTAFSAGTSLSSTTMNLAGAANTNQVLALSATPDNLLLDVGDSLGIVTTGVGDKSIGCITVHLVSFGLSSIAKEDGTGLWALEDDTGTWLFS